MASILGSLSWLMLTIGTPLEAALGDAIDSLVNLVQKAPGLLDFLPILNPKNWFAERSGWNTIETHQDKDLLDQIDKMNKPDNR